MCAADVRPLIVGVKGAQLEPLERVLLKELKPAGFILFSRNCVDAAQTRSLIQSLRELSPLRPPLIFIDQEGGRVARIRWEGHTPPPAKVFGDLFEKNPEEAAELCRLSAFVTAANLRALGITVNCAPVADVAQADGHNVIGDRAFHHDPQVVARLTSAAISGYLAGGVWPVMKHVPGHGRAQADSHNELPVVDTPWAELAGHDGMPFLANHLCPFFMSAHVLYADVDGKNCATQSVKVLAKVRDDWQLKGICVADDMRMGALRGSILKRAQQALAAGCELVIHAGGNLAGEAVEGYTAELEELQKLPAISAATLDKIAALPTRGQPDYELVEEMQSKLTERLKDVA